MHRAIYRGVALIGLVGTLTGCAANAPITPGAAPAPSAAAGPTTLVPGAVMPAPGVARTPLAGAAPGGASPRFSTQYLYKRSAARAPACAHAGRAIALPRGFPASFPFPPGTAITSVIGYRGDNTKPVISGIVPSTGFGPTVSFFLTGLPQAGFRLRDGEAEAAEAESVFVGHGYIGRWRLRALDTCSSAMVLFVFAEQYLLPAK